MVEVRYLQLSQKPLKRHPQRASSAHLMPTTPTQCARGACAGGRLLDLHPERSGVRRAGRRRGGRIRRGVPRARRPAEQVRVAERRGAKQPGARRRRRAAHSVDVRLRHARRRVGHVGERPSVRRGHGLVRRGGVHPRPLQARVAQWGAHAARVWGARHGVRSGVQRRRRGGVRAVPAGRLLRGFCSFPLAPLLYSGLCPHSVPFDVPSHLQGGAAALTLCPAPSTTTASVGATSAAACVCSPGYYTFPGFCSFSKSTSLAHLMRL